MYCRNCGQQIHDEAVICPKCGVATGKGNFNPNPAPAPVEKKPFNWMALVGLILAFEVPIAGLVFSILGKKRANELGGGGYAMAQAGFIVSIVEMVLITLVIIGYIFFVFLYAMVFVSVYG